MYSSRKVTISSDTNVIEYTPDEQIWPRVNKSAYRPQPSDTSSRDAELARITAENTTENTKKGQFNISPYSNYSDKVLFANKHYDNEFEGVTPNIGITVMGKTPEDIPERLLLPYQNEMLLVEILEKFILNKLIEPNESILSSILSKYPNLKLEQIIEVNNTVADIYDRLEYNKKTTLYRAGVNLRPVHQKYLNKMYHVLQPHIEIKEYNILLNKCNNTILSDLENLYNQRVLLPSC